MNMKLTLREMEILDSSLDMFLKRTRKLKKIESEGRGHGLMSNDFHELVEYTEKLQARLKEEKEKEKEIQSKLEKIRGHK